MQDDATIFKYLLPTAYVVRREGYILTHVCLFVHT